jgi:hypothetical protein
VRPARLQPEIEYAQTLFSNGDDLLVATVNYWHAPALANRAICCQFSKRFGRARPLLRGRRFRAWPRARRALSTKTSRRIAAGRRRCLPMAYFAVKPLSTKKFGRAPRMRCRSGSRSARSMCTAAPRVLSARICAKRRLHREIGQIRQFGSDPADASRRDLLARMVFALSGCMYCARSRCVPRAPS